MCTHRFNSNENKDLHLDFKVTKKGKLKRINYIGKVASKLGF